MKVTVKHIKSEINENNYKIIDKFIYFLQEQYPLKNDVVVNFVGERVYFLLHSYLLALPLIQYSF